MYVYFEGWDGGMEASLDVCGCECVMGGEGFTSLTTPASCPISNKS